MLNNLQHQKKMNQKHLKKMRRLLFMLGFFKIPMLFYCRPKLLELTDQKAVVRIRLRRRTRNHLKSMYFGALAVGADVSAGILMYHFAVKDDLKISFAFKAVKGEFLKRAETDVHFICDAGDEIKSVLEKAKSSGERQNHPVMVSVYNKENELVATFEMTTSVKVK